MRGEYKKPACVECGGKILKRTVSARICHWCTTKKFAATWAKTKEFRIANGIPLRADRGGNWHVDPHASLAHRMVALAIARKIIPHPSALSCADCGWQATEYDHRDYNRPLDIQPVCRGCNRRRGSAKPIDLPTFACLKVDATEPKTA